ncbi:MAG: hypothetical protein WAV73_03590 [Candidatus Moraniibacteriota bacterium]
MGGVGMLWDYRNGDIITTKKFFHGDNHDGCDQLAILSSAYRHFPFMMTCMKNSYCSLVAPNHAYRKPYDLLSANAFPQRIVKRSRTAVKALKLAINEHGVKRILLFQGPDFHKKNASSRFKTRWDEEVFHKQNLMEAARTINILHPDVEVVIVYFRIINEGRDAQFVEISMDGDETVRLITPYVNFESCQIAIILCMDYRFAKQGIDCVREFVGSPFEIISFAGSIRSFIEGSKHARKAVAVAYKRGCRKFVAQPHQDCGYFKGLRSFANPEEEKLFHEGQVDEFRSMMLNEYTDVEIIGIYNGLTEDLSRIRYTAC